MNKRKIWIPFILMGISLVLCASAFINSIQAEPQRYPSFGLIPCVIGIVSFLYVNKIADKKTIFLWFTQALNVAFIIFPLVTLLYFMSS